MIKRKSKERKFTKQQEKFIDLMARGYHTGKTANKMTLLEAHELAGYSPDSGNAHKLYKDLRDVIKAKRDEFVDDHQVASLAAAVVEEIMTDPDVNPQVRLKAAQDVLHRTGHDKPKELSVTNKVSEMSDAELDEQLASLIESSDNVKELKQA